MGSTTTLMLTPSHSMTPLPSKLGRRRPGYKIASGRNRYITVYSGRGVSAEAAEKIKG